MRMVNDSMKAATNERFSRERSAMSGVSAIYRVLKPRSCEGLCGCELTACQLFGLFMPALCSCVVK